MVKDMFTNELFSYCIPAFKLNVPLVYSPASKNHLGSCLTSIGIEKFEDQLSDYTYSKGSMKFPLNESLPLELIEWIVKFRI